MRLVFAGTPDAAVPSLEALIASDHEVAAVITRPDARAGRGRALAMSPVAQVAERHGIEVLKPTSPSDPQFLHRLRELQPACCPVVAYGALLRREALDIPEFGWINLHFSVLPAWRGAAPVQHSIMAGDEITGASVFSLTEGLDEGPVLGVITERIRSDDTAGSLLERLSLAGARLLVDALDHIEIGDIAAHPQPDENVSHAPKITTADAHIDWTRTAFAVDRQIRGCTPAPGAWSMLGDVRVKIEPVTVTGESSLAPGQVCFSKREVRVGTATVDVVLDRVQPHGKKPMAAADWGRGLSDPAASLT